MEDKEKDALEQFGAESRSEQSDESARSEAKKEKTFDKKKLIHLFSMIGLSAFFCAFYYCSMEISAKNAGLYYFFPIVMFSYMAALTVLVLFYIIYNRGFSRKGVTVDMLPAEWSDEKKREFVESGEKRLQRSKWILIFIIALLFTFIAEAIALFLIPSVRGWFN